MKKTIIAVLAAGSLVFAACGSDSGGGGDGGESQNELTDMVKESLDEAGIAYDADCISDKTSQLTDEDAEAIVAAGEEGDPDVSDAADAIGESMTECIELGS